MSLIQQKSHTGTPATEGGEDRWLDETQLIGKHFGRRIGQGGKYALQCFSAADNGDSRPLCKLTTDNVSPAKISELASWARLAPISYRQLLLAPKAIQSDDLVN